MGNTKRKIAEGLQEMMREKPFRKITVQDIMDCKNMKRQSFYYHFQDVYGVIEWLYHEDFVNQAVYNEEESLGEWICKAVGIIQDNHFFYRKVWENISRERLMEYLYPVVDEQIRKRCWENKDGNSMSESFIVKSVCHFMLDCMAMRKGPSQEEVLAVAQDVQAMLHMVKGGFLVIPTSKSSLTA